MNEIWASCNAVDWAIILITGLLTLWGLLKGFTSTLATLAGIALGYLVASRLYPQGALLLAGLIPDENLRNILSFTAIFVACVAVTYMVGRLVRKLINGIGLGWIDHLIGAGLGMAKGLLLSCIMILVLVAFLPPGSRYISESRLTPAVLSLVQIIATAAPPGLKATFNEKIEDLKQIWGQRAIDAIIERRASGAQQAVSPQSEQAAKDIP